MELIIFIFLIFVFAFLVWVLRKNRIWNEQEISHLGARLRLLEDKSPIQRASGPRVDFSRSK